MKFSAKLLARTALSSGLIATLGGTAALAADLQTLPTAPLPPPAFRLPAVSGINGKIDVAAGLVSSLQTFGPGYVPAFRVQGALSVPVGQALGIQVDGVVATHGGTLFTHAAGHFFWRNPSSGLAGAYASVSNWSGITRLRIGVEGEVYLGPVSIEALVGFEFFGVPAGLFADVDLAFYATEDLRISIGARRDFAGNSLTAGLEYQFASNTNLGWALFADAEIAPGYQALFAGLRLYFGDDKTLMRRHREDDPRIQADERSLIDCFGAYAADGLVALDAALECGVDID